MGKNTAIAKNTPSQLEQGLFENAKFLPRIRVLPGVLSPAHRALKPAIHVEKFNFMEMVLGKELTWSIVGSILNPKFNLLDSLEHIHSHRTI